MLNSQFAIAPDNSKKEWVYPPRKFALFTDYYTYKTSNEDLLMNFFYKNIKEAGSIIRYTLTFPAIAHCALQIAH